MGKLFFIERKGKKEYTVHSKKAFSNIKKLGNVLPEFAFNYAGRDKCVQTFYDTSDHMLASAGVIFCKVVKGAHAVFRVDSTPPRSSKYDKKVYIPKRYVQQISPDERVIDQLYFLTEGIEAVLYSKISIDLENVLKAIEPQMIIDIKRKKYLVSNGTGFKAEIAFEYVTYQNLETKRKVEDLLLRVKNMTLGDEKLDIFETLVSELEKYEKELIAMKGTKFDIAKRITQPLVKENKK